MLAHSTRWRRSDLPRRRTAWPMNDWLAPGTRPRPPNDFTIAADASLRTAAAEIDRAVAFIAARRRGVGETARTRVAEAQRLLALAAATATTDPDRARAITPTETLAREAYQAAQSDFSDWDMGGPGYGQRRGSRRAMRRPPFSARSSVGSSAASSPAVATRAAGAGVVLRGVAAPAAAAYPDLGGLGGGGGGGWGNGGGFGSGGFGGGGGGGHGRGGHW